MKILVIEDHPTQLKLAHDVLSASNNTVTTLQGAELAFEHIRADRPELILLDLCLPGMDGLALARKLKADPTTSEIAIVAITSFEEGFSRTDAMEAGCDSYLTKPLNTGTLSHDLGIALRKSEKGKELE